ncbi:MAG: hypothetical protein GKR91_03120 [Pseudomonadales bacterium]|nr:hypothetical protein [Pseudomonadales bacterium]
MQVVELNSFEFVRVSGPDTIEFLQGQLTCNMEALSHEKSLDGALCNLKGRVIADFQIALQQEDCILRTTGSTSQALLTTLSKYAVFSKVELGNDEQNVRAFGFLGADSTDFLIGKFNSLPEHANDSVSIPSGILLRLPGDIPRFELWCTDAELSTEIEREFTIDSDLSNWHRQDVKAGIIHVDSSASEEYTPQLLNYDLSGIIDFNKGCYTGQEVVARMFYRGKPKKRLYLLAGPELIDANEELQQLEGEGVKTAEVMTVSNNTTDSGEPNLVLAILNTSAVENQANFAFSSKPESFLQLQSLPYT